MNALETHLPLSLTDYHVLLSLAERSQHGYGLVKRIEERTGGTLQIEPANLYRRIRRFVDDGLLAETEPPADEASVDERRRYYALTELGRSVLGAEVERLRALVAAAEASGVAAR